MYWNSPYYNSAYYLTPYWDTEEVTAAAQPSVSTGGGIGGFAVKYDEKKYDDIMRSIKDDTEIIEILTMIAESGVLD